METNNVVLLRGTLTNDTVVRALASGDSVTQLELSTMVDGRSVTVPVSVPGSDVTVVGGDAVVVAGFVRRRFFRAGGVTQSRTEVVADDVIKATRRRTVERAVEAVLDAVGGVG